MDFKVGIGITTFNRPKHLDLCLAQIEKYTDNYNLFVNNDVERKGVAHAKNNCIEALKGNDFIFLFDDDCFPIKKGWEDIYINAHLNTEQNHFLYLNGTHILNPSYITQAGYRYINIYNNCGGCFMFLTKKVIDTVGGFDSRFGLYGFEHAEYSNRIYKSGLNTYGAYLSLANSSEYIYSLDYDNHLPFNKQVNHKPSLPFDIIAKEIIKNKAVYDSI